MTQELWFDAILVACAFACGGVALARRRPFKAGAFLGFVLGPVGLLIALNERDPFPKPRARNRNGSRGRQGGS